MFNSHGLPHFPSTSSLWESENIELFFVHDNILTRAEITFTFNGDDFGRVLLAFATDLPNICLQCAVGVVRCGCSSWNKKC